LPIEPQAERRTSVLSSAYHSQSTLASEQEMTATSRSCLVVSGIPAYAGTEVADETPGTTSKAIPALTHACASSGAEAKRNGSPAMRRTTRRPDFACRTTTLARAAWVSGCPSVPNPPSTISGPSGRVASAPSSGASGSPSSVRTSVAWPGTSVTTTSAARISSTARTVSRSGSPGPLPTKATCPAGRAGAVVVSRSFRVFTLLTSAF
jgi:hypothetical protein